jgi:hypothetical protein
VDFVSKAMVLCFGRFKQPQSVHFNILVNHNLDGGGVKSYSSLLILKELMGLVASTLDQIETTTDGVTSASQVLTSSTDTVGSAHNIQRSVPLKPSDVFDFVYGSSSGG